MYDNMAPSIYILTAPWPDILIVPDKPIHPTVDYVATVFVEFETQYFLDKIN